MKDMVEVIRCKDCVYWGTRCQNVTLPIGNAEVISGDCLNFFGHMTKPNFFCAFGERKSGETYEVKDGVRIKI